MKKLFTKDFTLVVIGQIISLTGNAILRFALPLHLLNQTGSATLFGLVSACAFIPMVLLFPIGGIVADRVNKRNIMVILDFFTAGLTLTVSLLLGKVDLVLLLVIALMLLYAIQGAYDPAVQASIPALVKTDQVMPANAVINQVSSLSTLIGPGIGGVLLSLWGLTPILAISAVCFTVSAIMEIFIVIPFTKRDHKDSLWKIVSGDLRDSAHFITKENPAIGKVMLVIALFNLSLSALIMISLPVIITQTMGFAEGLANQLTGYAQGALAVGGLAGGVLSGLFAKRLHIQKTYLLLFFAALLLLPMGLTLYLAPAPMVSYLVISGCCFLMMTLSTLFAVLTLSYVQTTTPKELVGKVISCAMAFSISAQPIGQAIYGWLFDHFSPAPIFFGAAVVSAAIALASRHTFASIEDEKKTANAAIKTQ